jgi:uncharacterized membrane protein YcaP (DUF421 family)
MIFLHWLMTRVACRWHWFGDLIKGQAVVVVRDGLPLRDVMRVHHISPHDLEEEMRLQGVDDVSQVRLAIKERNGEISVLKRDASG